MALSKPNIIHKIQWNNRFAQVQRFPPRATDKAIIIAVASMDNRVLTSGVAALLSHVIDSEAQVPVVTVDADGMNQPLRPMLGAGSGGDLVGLATHTAGFLNRQEIETYVDMNGAIPLLSCWEQGPGQISPLFLDTSVRRVQHRWPAVVLNLPPTCAPETIAAGVRMAGHVFLVADKHHSGHDWLYQPGHQLSESAQHNRVTVLTLGGKPKNLAPDTIHLPHTGLGDHQRELITVPTDPESLTVFRQILNRIYRDDSSQ